MNEKTLIYIIKQMESKLKEFMSPGDFAEFSAEIAKGAFRIDCEEMADGEFKQFVLNHFDEIVGEDDANV